VEVVVATGATVLDEEVLLANEFDGVPLVGTDGSEVLGPPQAVTRPMITTQHATRRIVTSPINDGRWWRRVPEADGSPISRLAAAAGSDVTIAASPRYRARGR
jgi:hypothetical protein